MAIEDLFDHRAEVWRIVQVTGLARDVQQVPQRVHAPGSRANCAIVPPRVRTDDIGPGETTRGRVEVYLDTGVDVVERDVIRIIAGPMVGRTYRAVSVARVRGHHAEVVVEPWVGELPEVSA